MPFCLFEPSSNHLHFLQLTEFLAVNARELLGAELSDNLKGFELIPGNLKLFNPQTG